MAKGPESPSSNVPDNTTPRSDASSQQAKPDQARASASPPGETSPGGRPAQAGRTVSQRKSQYLVAPRKVPGMQLMGLQPLLFSVIEQTLRSSPDIEVVDTVGPKNMGTLADGMIDAPSVLVTRMTDQKANVLHQQARGQLIIERDEHLTLLDPAFQPPALVMGATPTSGPVLEAQVIVLGRDNAPVKDAEVYLFGSFIPATGVTDERGAVTLSLFGETEESIRSLYVKPKSDYWSFFQTNPDISGNEPNLVGLRALSDWPSLANFPQRQALGWGQKAMRLDHVPPAFRGQGIKVAVIDSGAATTHQDLQNIHNGFDIINKRTHPDTWNQDTVAHGSHCAGVIAGADGPGGVRGFAPDAEVHVCKLFPGGQVSQLIDALEYCIEKQIDVVNLSLGGAAPSEALEQQLLRAKRAGVACIVASGNSGGPVQYPASSPHVLAVAAIGKLNEFPPDSYHSQTVTQNMDANGFFSAKFSCYGPQIAVCAPGVAIASSVPANNYAVWDGTSMAAPHVTGLAALVLAHHPDFQNVFNMKSAERVDRLFQIIKLSARAINLGDPARTGFGMPDALVALGLQPPEGMAISRTLGNVPQGTIGSLLNTPPGGSAGQNMPFSSVGNPAAVFGEQAQFLPQSWLANPWGQGGQQPGGAFQPMANAIDNTLAAYLPAFYSYPQPIGGGGFQGFRYNPGAPGFGRAGW
ncbi:MAG: in [Herminiimonas sp.]|nr:in [Herminiimonas sp.]